jgi:hypothetical protein
MRNIILALGSVASLTFAGLTTAFSAGLCTDNPCLDNSPIQGALGNSPTQRPSYQTYGSSYQVPPRHIRHARSYNAGYRHHG